MVIHSLYLSVDTGLGPRINVTDPAPIDWLNLLILSGTTRRNNFALFSPSQSSNPGYTVTQYLVFTCGWHQLVVDPRTLASFGWTSYWSSYTQVWHRFLLVYLFAIGCHMVIIFSVNSIFFEFSYLPNKTGWCISVQDKYQRDSRLLPPVKFAHPLSFSPSLVLECFNMGSANTEPYSEDALPAYTPMPW